MSEELRMPVVVIQTLPADASQDMVRAVNKELGAAANPPDGLIVHTASGDDGQIKIIDVWESQQQFESFAENTLTPTVMKVMAAAGMNPEDGAPPQIEIRDVFDWVRA
jgi:hypothetical protein